MSDDAFGADELAGIVDLFGALTREELSRALAELDYRQGRDGDAEAHRSAIDRAVESFVLVEYEPATDSRLDGPGDGEHPDAEHGPGTLLAPGPVAFPALPEDAEDLPHILDVPARSVDRDALAGRVERRLRAEAARAVEAGDSERMRSLLDVTYDLEAWADADVASIRERLDDALSE